MDSETKARWDGALTLTLVVCALITTGLVVHREIFQRPTPASPQALEPVFIRDWRVHLQSGFRFGPSSAAVQLIEFADFECPACASYHATLKTILARYPTQVSLVFVHYPIPGHRFAEPAARTAECAGDQGYFELMHDRLFKEQARLGLKTWRQFASDVAIPDLEKFESCIQKQTPEPKVDMGRQLGDQLGIQGTPTLVINGWKLTRPPSVEEIDRMVQSILSGRSPVGLKNEAK